MTAEEALHRHLVARGVLEAASAPEHRYEDHAIWLSLGPLRIPFPILNPRGALVLHDLHHLIAGYPFDWRGELEVASWELGSGGCYRHLLYCLDRVSFCLVGMLVAPRTTLRALSRGRHHRNLYARDPAEVLRRDVGEVRSWVLGRPTKEAPC